MTHAQVQPDDADRARIFVLIPSYRDAECQWTVKDLFDKATHPGRVFIGILWQYDPDEDRHCFSIEAPRPAQVRTRHYHWRDSLGVCWARHEGQKLWQGEEYTFMTDAHMRFAPGWDVAMIAELAECPSPKPVISCNPAGYTPPDVLVKNPLPTIRRATPFSEQGEMRFRGEGLDIAPDHPLNGAFVANGYVFARSSIITEVPYDPHLYFNQEECTFTARLWTHGWDIFHSRQVLSYHYYYTPPKDGPKQRPLHWSDNEKWRLINERAHRRYNHLFGHTLSKDPEVLRDIEAFAMGTERSLEDYQAYCGIDFRRRTVSERALRCLFIEGLEKYRKRPIVDAHETVAAPAPTAAPAQPLPVAKAAPAPAPAPPRPAPVPLGAGDFLPHFELDDHNGRTQEIHLYVGKPLLLLCIGRDDEAACREFLAALPELQRRCLRARIFLVPVLEMEPAAVRTLLGDAEAPLPLWTDPGGELCAALGLRAGSPARLLSMEIDSNLKIRSVSRWTGSVADACAKLPAEVPEPTTERHAPVLLVERALGPELCARLIAHWKSSERFEGKVGAGTRSAFNYGSKRRVDCHPDAELQREIDQALARSLLPELRKVFGFDARYREAYKVGCYDASDAGFFNAHRDNFDPELAHRRVALSLNLNDDFEGGELEFPEYGPQGYKPRAGDAVIFPCALMHRVAPMKSGRRFALVSFFFGEQEEQYRLQRRARAGLPASSASCRMAQPTDPAPALRLSVDAPALVRQSLATAPAPRNLLAQRVTDTPEGILLIENYLDRERCDALARYADRQAFSKLKVVDYEKSASGRVETMESRGRVTDHVNIDGRVAEILSLFNDIYCNQLAPFYDVQFEWYERPQILRYPPGGLYNRHADADHWVKETRQWVRSQDRDYSVLLYLNEEFEGGSLYFPTLDFRFRPRAGMLAAFPSDHRYLHEAEPTTSGIRYVIVSWAAVLGSPRVRDKPPYANVFLRQKRDSS